jgi:2-dehydro-3-deoxygluconokinase
LRYSPLANDESFVQQHMPVFVGGAELNVAQALALWKIPTAYCTAMPDNFLTESILQFIDKKNIDTSVVYKSGERLGIYYLAQGKDVKSEAVVFDRAGSSFATLQTGQINWEIILKDKTWFHFSAIAASLSQAATAVCLEALQAAKKMGLTISVDLNYRNKLWKYGKQPVEVMPTLVKYCDVIMGNLWAVETLLGIASPIKTSEGKTMAELKTAATESMALLQKEYASAKNIAYTYRLEENYFAIIKQENDIAFSTLHEVKNAIDKVGSGDCFMAGLIYGILKKEPAQSVIDFAASAAVGKLYEKGDSTLQQVAQIKERY